VSNIPNNPHWKSQANHNSPNRQRKLRRQTHKRHQRHQALATMITPHFRISHVLKSPNALLHAPLMHLTPCYISFPLRYSIAPANKILGKTAPIPGAARRRPSCFLFLRPFGASSVLTRSSNNTALAVSFFSFESGGDSAFKAGISFKGAIFGKERFNYSHPLQIHSCGPVVASACCFPAFFALYICISLLICYHCKQKFHMVLAARYS
jgi:hypothetical protein